MSTHPVVPDIKPDSLPLELNMSSVSPIVELLEKGIPAPGTDSHLEIGSSVEGFHQRVVSASEPDAPWSAAYATQDEAAVEGRLALFDALVTPDLVQDTYDPARDVATWEQAHAQDQNESLVPDTYDPTHDVAVWEQAHAQDQTDEPLRDSAVDPSILSAIAHDAGLTDFASPLINPVSAEAQAASLPAIDTLTDAYTLADVVNVAALSGVLTVLAEVAAHSPDSGSIQQTPYPEQPLYSDEPVRVQFTEDQFREWIDRGDASVVSPDLMRELLLEKLPGEQPFTLDASGIHFVHEPSGPGPQDSPAITATLTEREAAALSWLSEKHWELGPLEVLSPTRQHEADRDPSISQPSLDTAAPSKEPLSLSPPTADEKAPDLFHRMFEHAKDWYKEHLSADQLRSDLVGFMNASHDLDGTFHILQRISGATIGSAIEAANKIMEYAHHHMTPEPQQNLAAHVDGLIRNGDDPGATFRAVDQWQNPGKDPSVSEDLRHLVAESVARKGAADGLTHEGIVTSLNLSLPNSSDPAHSHTAVATRALGGSESPASPQQTRTPEHNPAEPAR